MKRGTRVKNVFGLEGVVLGPEDFSGYEYNRPNEKWELVDYGNGYRVWSGHVLIEAIS